MYYLRITIIWEAGKPADLVLRREQPPRQLLYYVDLRTKATYKLKIPFFALFFPDDDKKHCFTTFLSTTMASNVTPIDYATIITTIPRTGLSVTRRVILMNYFDHLQFVVTSCLEKTSDLLLEEYNNSNKSDDQVYKRLESIFPVIGCLLMLYNSFCGEIVFGSLDVSTIQDITARARKEEKIVLKEAKQKNADAQQEFSNKRRCIKTFVKISKHPIDNQQTALIWYTAERLFLNDYVQKKIQAENYLEYEKHSRFNEAMSIAKQKWKQETTINRRVWEAKSRQHDAEQSYIRDRIIGILRANPSKGFRQIACEINDWCSHAAINRWMTSHDTYCKNVERNLPVLSQQQMVKHVAFLQLVRNNWGLPQTKYLWIHYDEKWFFGFLR
jgi:hypothetical protein